MANGSKCQRRSRSRAEPSPHSRRSIVYSSVCLSVCLSICGQVFCLGGGERSRSCQLPVASQHEVFLCANAAQGEGLANAMGLDAKLRRSATRWLGGSLARWLGLTWLGYPAPPSATCSDLKWAAMHCSVYAGKQSMRWKQAVIPSHTHKESVMYVWVNICVCVWVHMYLFPLHPHTLKSVSQCQFYIRWKSRCL